MSAFARSKFTVFTGAVLLGFAACTGAQSLAAPPGGPLPQTQASPSNERDESAPIPPLTGRLFFSREQRERMDRARARGAAGEMALSGESFADPPAAVLNGFVKRSDGHFTVWLDSLPRYNIVTDRITTLQPQDVGGDSGGIELRGRERQAAEPRASIKKKSAARRQSRPRAAPAHSGK